MANRFTSFALVNLSAKGYPDQDSELGELIERASDVIVVLDLDETGEDIVTSAIDGEYGEALPDGLALRINSWAHHREEDETDAGRARKIVQALRVAHEACEGAKLVEDAVTAAYEKVLDAVMYGHPEAVINGWSPEDPQHV